MSTAVQSADAVIPGTVRLVDVHGNIDGQHASTRRDIVLVPTPSSHPDDPLNWTRSRKLLHCFCISLYTMAVGVSATVLLSVFQPIISETELTLTDLNNGTGYMFLMLGLGCIPWQVVVNMLGKRFSYCSSLLLTAALNMWAPYATSRGTWIASRLLLGVVGAPIQFLCGPSIADMFFAHERGTYLFIYSCTLLSSSQAAPLPAGFISDALGWKWVLYLTALFNLVAFIICALFMEETNFNREPDVPSTQKSRSFDDKDEKIDVEDTAPVAMSPIPTRPKSWLRRMKPVHRPEKMPPVLPRFWRPFYLLSLPAIAFSGLTAGSGLCIDAVYNATVSLVFSGPPYSFRPSMVGLTFAGPLLAGGIGAVLGGPVNDWIALRLARRNGGIQESEHRLWPLAFATIVAPAALIIWGVGAAHGVHWMVLELAGSLISAAVVQNGSISIQYTIDAYHDLGSEAMVSVILVRNLMDFGVGYAVTPWVQSLGIQNSMISAAFVALALVGTFLPMIFFGKRLRIATKDRYERIRLGTTGN